VSYEIHPETPAAGRPLSDYFGGADLGPMHEGLARRADEFGLRFAPPERLSNSRLAILTAEFARDHGREQTVRRRLFEAYFADGLDIGDLDVLLKIATDEGLNTQVLRRSLKAGVLAPRITQAETEARHRRITGVPTFFFFTPDSEESVPVEAASVVGAQPLDTFRRVLDRLT
jgi:predicted DsbA family dithiol-disulfide isomerase